MGYPDRAYYITFLFERLEDFTASVMQRCLRLTDDLSHMQTRA